MSMTIKVVVYSEYMTDMTIKVVVVYSECMTIRIFVVYNDDD